MKGMLQQSHRFADCHSITNNHLVSRKSIAQPRPSFRSITIHAQSSTQQNVAAWDPEGILKNAPAGGHFARREQALQRTAQRPTPPPGTAPIIPIPEPYRNRGIPAHDTSLYDKKELKSRLSKQYMPIDFDYHGLHILNIEPPVFLVKSFFSAEECTTMINAGVGTGKMQQSKVGAGNVTDTTLSTTMSSRRTSTSILVDELMQQAHPELKNPAQSLQKKGMKLLGADSMSMPWGRSGKLPRIGQYCYEALQFAQYRQGQFFLEHEDAFPIEQARENGFQRSATLLVYLNDVEKGGATTFQYLDLAVQPVCGDALIFFPGFSDGNPDARTLHKAEPAEDLKSVVQQWVARGVGRMNDSSMKKDDDGDVEALLLVASSSGKKSIQKSKKSKSTKSSGGGGGFGRK